MASLTQNNIQFTLNADIVKSYSGKYTHYDNYDSTTNKYKVNQNKLNNIGVTKSLNAVELDWNDADLQSAVNAITDIPEGLPTSLTDGKIKSTGDLLQERIQQNSPMFARVA